VRPSRLPCHQEPEKIAQATLSEQPSVDNRGP
jgi:hypothetical protein